MYSIPRGKNRLFALLMFSQSYNKSRVLNAQVGDCDGGCCCGEDGNPGAACARADAGAAVVVVEAGAAVGVGVAQVAAAGVEVARRPGLLVAAEAGLLFRRAK